MAQVVSKIEEGREAGFWGLGGCILPYELTHSKKGAAVWKGKGPGSREISFTVFVFYYSSWNPFDSFSPDTLILLS